VGVWINDGHTPEDGGKPWKHLDPHCPLLEERAARGFPIRKLSRNPDNRKPVEQHLRRRCPHPGCFTERTGLRSKQIRAPRWLADADLLERSSAPDAWWTYLLADPKRHQFQVGKAKSLHARLQSRWKATLKGGFDRADTIPWLHDRLVEDPDFCPEVTFHSYATEADALAGERRIRAELRAKGWHDSSDV
jgi:hypothetical protein